MFGIGSTELLLILVVALLVLGPKNLPKVAHTLGRAMGEFRRVSTEFQRTLNTEIALEEQKEKQAKAEKELTTNADATQAVEPVAASASPVFGKLEIPNPAVQSQAGPDATSGQVYPPAGQPAASSVSTSQSSVPSDAEDKA